MVPIGSGAERQQQDYKLSRYACKAHNKIGKIVRKAIKDAGGTMPEELPTPEKSLKQLGKEQPKELN